MPGLTDRLAAVWRAIFTPAAVRDLEDADPEQAAAELPVPPTKVPEPRQGVDAMHERLERIERRNRELARLYDRRREE